MDEADQTTTAIGRWRKKPVVIGLTDVGHHPSATTMLTTALAPHVDNPVAIAADVFCTLHDAGLRIVPAEVVNPLTGNRIPHPDSSQ